MQIIYSVPIAGVHVHVYLSTVHHFYTQQTLLDYIRSPHRSDEERKDRILSAILLQEGDSIDRLVDCLLQETSHSGHKYLARRLREAVEKKQQHPDSECKLG